MKQTLGGVSKQSWSVVPFLGVNRQDISMHARKGDESRDFFLHYYGDEAAKSSPRAKIQPAKSCGEAT